LDKSGVKGLRRSIVDQEIKTSKRRTGPAAAEAQFLSSLFLAQLVPSLFFLRPNRVIMPSLE